MTKPIAGSAVPDGAAFADAHRRLLADGSIQFNLDMAEPPVPPPAWLESLGRFVSTIWPAVEIVFWLAVALAVLYLLYAIVTRLSGRGWPWRRRSKPAVEESLRPAETPARQLLGAADALAAEGRFSEAARLLLFRSIEEIDAKRPELVRPAFTSRDIARLPALPDRPRAAFAAIAMLVERSLFARRDLGPEDWRDCRAAYEAFAFADGWRG